MCDANFRFVLMNHVFFLGDVAHKKRGEYTQKHNIAKSENGNLNSKF